MRYCKTAIWILTLVISTYISVIAQEAAPAISAKRDFKHGELIVVETGTRKGIRRTVVALHMSVTPQGAGTSPLAALALFTYPGNAPARPDSISLSFTARLSQPVFQEVPEVTISFGDETIHRQGVTWTFPDNFPTEAGIWKKGEVSVLRTWESYSKTDSLSLQIPTEMFLRMVKTEGISLSSGAIEFRFNNSQMEALRDFASRMVP